MKYMALGMKRDKALSITRLTTHQYYYKPKSGKCGRKPSSSTSVHLGDKTVEVPNEKVVEEMKEIQSNIDIRCGKDRMTSQMQLRGYRINHKKVYRLMKQNDLLLAKPKAPTKNYVKHRIISPLCPLSHLEMDIKFVWLEDLRTHAKILTIIDIFTRKVLEWHAGISITKHTVKRLFEKVILNHLQEKDMLSSGIEIEIRNDNDKRFSAGMVQDFFKENYLNQVFTHPYTPQENGHIESFHKTLSQAIKGQSFFKLNDLEQRLIIFYNNYNNHRVHGSICGLTPQLFEEAWDNGHLKRIELKNRKVKYKLSVNKTVLSGNGILREASCSKDNSLDVNYLLDADPQINKDDAIYYQNKSDKQPSVQRSPSVASCWDKVIIFFLYYCITL